MIIKRNRQYFSKSLFLLPDEVLVFRYTDYNHDSSIFDILAGNGIDP